MLFRSVPRSHRGTRTSSPASQRPPAPGTMKSDGPGTAASKPGDADASRAKNGRSKPGDPSSTAKPKASPSAKPVLNGTGGPGGTRREAATANGPRGSLTGTGKGVKEQERKPNPGARPKTSPPGSASAGPAAKPGKLQKTRGVSPRWEGAEQRHGRPAPPQHPLHLGQRFPGEQLRH